MTFQETPRNIDHKEPDHEVQSMDGYVLRVWIGLNTLDAILTWIAFAMGAGSEWTLQAFVIATILGHLLNIAVASLRISQHTRDLLSKEPADAGGDTGGRFEGE